MIRLSFLRKTLEIPIFLATRRRNLANAFLTKNGLTLGLTRVGGRVDAFPPAIMFSLKGLKLSVDVNLSSAELILC